MVLSVRLSILRSMTLNGNNVDKKMSSTSSLPPSRQQSQLLPPPFFFLKKRNKYLTALAGNSLYRGFAGGLVSHFLRETDVEFKALQVLYNSKMKRGYTAVTSLAFLVYVRRLNGWIQYASITA